MRCHKSPKTGQSLVEIALVFPVLMTFFLIIIELGVVFSVYVGLTNSAREGARLGSLYRYQCPDPVNNPNCMANQDFAVARNTVDTARRTAINQAIDGTLNPLVDPPDVTRGFAYDPLAGTSIYRYGDKLIVTLTHQHRLFFSLLGGPTLTVQASSAMRMEPGGR